MLKKYYINIDKNSEEYGWVYEEISVSGNRIEVGDELTGSIDFLNKDDLKEISEAEYKEILDKNAAKKDDEVLKLKKEILSKVENVKDQIRRDVEICFKEFFTEYTLPEEFIDLSIEDVMECSSFLDEENYNDSDVRLACQRVIIRKLGL